MAEHTPWRIANEDTSFSFVKGRIIRDCKDDIVCIVPWPNSEPGRTNLKILATAPLLLQACEAALTVLQNLPQYNVPDDEMVLRTRLEAAVKKVTEG